MRPGTNRPTGVERPFVDDEIIVSKTDLKGRLTYVNDVFVRVSAFDEADLIGEPHNIIRHPDMPGAVFKLLWDSLQRGEEVFAYIVNLARDGGHYWVLAHVTPTRGADGQVIGYHSNRRTASAGARAVVEPLYATLLAEERRHSKRTDAVDASAELLSRHLAALGQSYDEFVWSLDDADALEDVA